MGGHNKLDLVGQKFHRLTVVEYAGVDASKQTLFKCVCDCGNEKITRGASLTNDVTKSCGCLRKEQGQLAGLRSKVHGMIKTPTHNSWSSMKARCLNPLDDNYRFYGAKGVTICERWMDFQNFYEDMGTRPDSTSLDRINPFGNYELSNCRWATAETQLQNTRKNYKGELCPQ